MSEFAGHFASGGVIASSLGDGFEPRPQQVEMAEAIARHMARGRGEDGQGGGAGALMIEAATGVGKSFAYLLPAIDRIVRHGERVVIATNTIALQEQLVSKDIPLLAAAFSDEETGEPAFKAELVKGRGNYMSIRRLALASKKQQKLFSDGPSRRSLEAIETWAYDTEDGTLATLPQLERPGVWDRVMSDSGNCMGRKCPTYQQCFYQQARRRAERADLLVCNHALFFSDLALRVRDVGFLPAYDHVILDEAHNAEEVASEHFGLSLSEGRVHHLLNALLTPSRGKGFLATLSVSSADAGALEKATARVMAAERASRVFFERLVDMASRAGGAGRGGGDVGGTYRLHEPDLVENTVSEAFGRLALALKQLKEAARNDEDRYELNSYAQRASAVAEEAEMLVEQQLEGCAYWIETSRSPTGRSVRATLACSPIDVAPILAHNLFSRSFSVTLTSATLTTGGGASNRRVDDEDGSDPAFAHLADRLGCPGAETLALGSPFDHASQLTLYLHPRMPDPRERTYTSALAEAIGRHVVETRGGAFVLFTSFATMHRVADEIGGRLEDEGLMLMTHGRDGSRAQMLDRFRLSPGGVLFGAASFWQGVDVRGDALRNVVITRLPFEPPDRPLTEARHEMIRSRGGSPFMQDTLPRAVIRFKQGFGRLIRSASDTGRVVVLDSRIVTKPYGRLFLGALPEGVVPVVEDG